MKRRFLQAALCLFLINGYGVLMAQNKTLGVGVTTPNANAALHVESPTSNQGFIMPRLTTVQRQAMNTLLTPSDKGLMLFDTDLNAIFIWDGVSWKSSSTFSIDDPASSADGLTVTTQGTGSAGRFTLNNPATFSHAVHAENNGDSTSAAVHGNHTGNGFGVFGKSAGSKFASAAVYGEHVGVGDAAGAFRISNPANPYSALFGETNGSGSAIYGNQIGLGRAGQFQITNALNTEAAIRGYTAGTGFAGFYTINNASNASAGIFSTTNGSGPAVMAENTGAGAAANFSINNASNGAAALIVNNVGTGATLQLNQSNNGMAIEMVSGGLKYSIVTISTAGNITAVAALYKITAIGTYTLPTAVPEGTFCKVFNASTEMITVESGSVFASDFRDFIFINGKWY